METGLRGKSSVIDVARMNGECFAVMAGAGFDADMIDAADGALKDKLGRAAYILTGTKSFRTPPFKAQDHGRRKPVVHWPSELHPGGQRRLACSPASRYLPMQSPTMDCSTWL